MKRLIYILCIAFTAIGCATDEETEQVNQDDLDGDGVTNQQEAVVNTDPNNPCSLIINNQYYPSVSNAWKALDCDGDGVTNWRELDPDGNNIVEDNGTDPLEDCSLIYEHQTLEPKPSWLIRDCDFDGVTNEQEIIDGTNVLDPCDLIIASQIEVPTTGWQNGDCDNDGYNNGREIEDGTDLFDPTDFDGAGSILARLDYGNRSLRFINNGARYDKIVTEANESVVTSYEYDGQGNLIRLFDSESNSSGDDLNIHYTYNNNNQITHVLRTVQSEEDYSYNVTYDDNQVFTYDGTEPSGLYTKKLTFNTDEVLTSIERFIPYDGTYVYETETYEYDTSFENILAVRTEANQGYDELTGDFFPLNPDLQYTNEFIYSYEQTNMNNGVLNPFYEADQDIKLNIILDLRISLSGINYLYNIDHTSNDVNTGNIFFQHSVFSRNFIARYDRTFERGDGYTSTGFYRWVPTYVQDNDLPIRANTTGSSPVYFYYE